MRTNTKSYTNSADIQKDSEKAKKIGVSYGKYKAGITESVKETAYSVSSVDIIRKTEKKDIAEKACAFIKI